MSLQEGNDTIFGHFDTALVAENDLLFDLRFGRELLLKRRV